ncbi:golgin subfamily A member 6-like protein 22 [Palaemon carinicauda]|uniref:golgin subfamily A member 6-like protein 22 n=1 Tax=Palaemon carinicauda TaxID=392227 RepID=UPI0035B663EB
MAISRYNVFLLSVWPREFSENIFYIFDVASNNEQNIRRLMSYEEQIKEKVDGDFNYYEYTHCLCEERNNQVDVRRKEEEKKTKNNEIKEVKREKTHLKECRPMSRLENLVVKKYRGYKKKIEKLVKERLRHHTQKKENGREEKKKKEEDGRAKHEKEMEKEEKKKKKKREFSENICYIYDIASITTMNALGPNDNDQNIRRLMSYEEQIKEKVDGDFNCYEYTHCLCEERNNQVDVRRKEEEKKTKNNEIKEVKREKTHLKECRPMSRLENLVVKKYRGYKKKIEKLVKERLRHHTQKKENGREEEKKKEDGMGKQEKDNEKEEKNKKKKKKIEKMEKELVHQHNHKEKENGREEEKKKEDGMGKQEKDNEKEEKNKKKKKKIEKMEKELVHQHNHKEKENGREEEKKKEDGMGKQEKDNEKEEKNKKKKKKIEKMEKELVHQHNHKEKENGREEEKKKEDGMGKWEEFLKDRKEREEEYHKQNERSQEEEQAKKTTDPNRQKEQEEIIARLKIEIKRLGFRIEILDERKPSPEFEFFEKDEYQLENLTPRQVYEAMTELYKPWNLKRYHLMTNNCQSMLRELLEHLGVEIPETNRLIRWQHVFFIMWTNAEVTSVESLSTLSPLKEIPMFWNSETKVCGSGYGKQGPSGSRAIERNC